MICVNCGKEEFKIIHHKEIYDGRHKWIIVCENCGHTVIMADIFYLPITYEQRLGYGLTNKYASSHCCYTGS